MLAMNLGFRRSLPRRPVQAALTSAASFAVGASMPLFAVLASPSNSLFPLVTIASLGFLGLLGAIGGKAGGANVLRATARVTFWGALAMALTAGIGALVGARISLQRCLRCYFRKASILDAVHRARNP